MDKFWTGWLLGFASALVVFTVLTSLIQKECKEKSISLEAACSKY